jgi:lincosamide nucleotidyltransferase
MIDRVRELCRQDERIVGALMYGSFTKGEGDTHSDIEFCIYLVEDDYDDFDPVTWLEQIAPVAVFYTNEFGIGTAIFENLIRGEFHFDRAEDMAQIPSWKKISGFPPVENMLVVDKTGELTRFLQEISGAGPERALAENIAWLWDSYLNWMIFGTNVLARGERVRAADILGFVQRYLLWMVRVKEKSTEHWPTPSKNVENDISPTPYERFVVCTASLKGQELERAYQSAWEWGKELADCLAGQYDFDSHPSLVQKIEERVSGILM